MTPIAAAKIMLDVANPVSISGRRDDISGTMCRATISIVSSANARRLTLNHFDH